MGGKANQNETNRKSHLIYFDKRHFELVNARLAGSTSYWKIILSSMSCIFSFLSQTYIFNFIISFHRWGKRCPAGSNLPKIAWAGRGTAGPWDLKAAHIPRPPHCSVPGTESGEQGLWGAGGVAQLGREPEDQRPGLHFFYRLLIPTHMVLDRKSVV